MKMAMSPFKDEGDPRFTEKIDVLDLLINIIKEHEEKLDEITTKLETISEIMSKTIEEVE